MRISRTEHTMKLLVIIGTVIVCSYAAPAIERLHLSPVNPDVLVAPKPEEKIVLITDPKEVAKFKRETKQPLYPTVLPELHDHLLRKRDDKSSDQKHDITVPSVAKLHRHEEPSKESEEEKSDAENKVKNSEYKTVNDRIEHHVSIQNFQKPQISKDTAPVVQQHKRDIPVPLVPKHHHIEESLKGVNEKVPLEKTEEDYTSSPYVPLTQVHEQENSFKVVQQKDQGLPAILKETESIAQQQKRETLVSSVSEQESPKNENSDAVNKHVKSENHKVPEMYKFPKSMSSKNVKDVTNYSLDKPQTLSIHREVLSQNENQKQNIQRFTDHNHKNLLVQSSQSLIDQNNQQPEEYRTEMNNKRDVTKSSKHTTLSVQDDHKTNIKNDKLSMHDFTASTTDHPLIRNRPVPVAELFAKSHDN